MPETDHPASLLLGLALLACMVVSLLAARLKQRAAQRRHLDRVSIIPWEAVSAIAIIGAVICTPYLAVALLSGH